VVEAFREQERLNAGADFIADEADLVEGKVFRIGEWPVFAAKVRDIGAGFAATHGDEKRGVAGDYVGEELGLGGVEIDADFAHGFYDDRVDARAGVGSCGEGAGLCGVDELVKQGGGHLGAAGVMDAGEDVDFHGCQEQQVGPQQVVVAGLSA
jgi:hypothetical protein